MELQARGSREREPGGEGEQERRRQRDELGAGEHERREQPGRGEAGVAAELRRRPPRHVRAVRSSAAGVGTVSSRSRTTSSADTRCTHSSGRSVSRCASAGTATDFHVVGRDVVAAVERRAATRQLEQRERAARRRADLNRLRVARRGDDVDHVEADRLGDVDVLASPPASRAASRGRRAASARARRCRARRGSRAPAIRPCARG